MIPVYGSPFSMLEAFAAMIPKEIGLDCSSLIWYNKPTVYKRLRGGGKIDLLIREITTVNKKRG